MNMYKNDFVAVLKNNGKILREENNRCQLPFGCEYSILMKNLRAQKTVVSVSIDGKDVLNGNQLIIDPNSELELERFLDDISEGNRFKFIQKTGKIQEHRGDKIDDGIIRIEFQYEQQYSYAPCHDPYWHTHTTFPTYNPTWKYDTYTTCGGTTPFSTTPFTVSSTSVVNNLNADKLDGKHASDFLDSNIKIKSMGDSISASVLNKGDSFSSSATTCKNGTSTSSYDTTLSSNLTIGGVITTSSSMTSFGEIKGTLNTSSLPLQDEGITVKGSKSSQKFQKGYVGILESQKHVITLKLNGFKDNGEIIKKPVTVKTKKICDTCGTSNKSYSKYCIECGTYLN